MNHLRILRKNLENSLQKLALLISSNFTSSKIIRDFNTRNSFFLCSWVSSPNSLKAKKNKNNNQPAAITMMVLPIVLHPPLANTHGSRSDSTVLSLAFWLVLSQWQHSLASLWPTHAPRGTVWNPSSIQWKYDGRPRLPCYGWTYTQCYSDVPFAVHGMTWLVSDGMGHGGRQEKASADSLIFRVSWHIGMFFDWLTVHI